MFVGVVLVAVVVWSGPLCVVVRLGSVLFGLDWCDFNRVVLVFAVAGWLGCSCCWCVLVWCVVWFGAWVVLFGLVLFGVGLECFVYV